MPLIALLVKLVFVYTFSTLIYFLIKSTSFPPKNNQSAPAPKQNRVQRIKVHVQDHAIPCNTHSSNKPLNSTNPQTNSIPSWWLREGKYIWEQMVWVEKKNNNSHYDTTIATYSSKQITYLFVLLTTFSLLSQHCNFILSVIYFKLFILFLFLKKLWDFDNMNTILKARISRTVDYRRGAGRLCSGGGRGSSGGRGERVIW